jgi:hypothetical protein
MSPDMFLLCCSKGAYVRATPVNPDSFVTCISSEARKIEYPTAPRIRVLSD